MAYSTVTTPLLSAAVTRRHDVVRANPCAGFLSSESPGPNQGKQIGMPPRIALPGVKALAELIQSTGRGSSAGRQAHTCAP